MNEMIDRAREQFNSLVIESRIFVIIGSAGILFSLISTVVNLMLDLGAIPVLSTTLTTVIALLFVYQVYKTERYSYYSTIILLILTLIIYPVSWITSGGSQGTIPFFFIFNFIIIAVMLKRRRIIPMILLNLCSFWGLYAYEYFNADSITYYNSDLKRMIDSGIFLTIISLSLFFVMYWIMKEYNKKIGKLNETREQLSLLSLTDTLSGLYNRRHVMVVLKKERLSGNLLSLIMIDIDHFKNVNDTYGHNIGDEVITRIGQTLKTNLRGSDVISRIGGEEFLVVLRNDDQEIALRIAEKLRSLVEDLKWKNIQGVITISAGVYVSNSQDSVYDMLEKVDMGLYQAKNNGRNQVVPYQENQERIEAVVS